MFVSIVGEVEVDRPVALPVTHGEAMHAELLRRIAALDPGIAAQLHGEPDGSARPYTVSALQVDRPVIREGKLYLETGAHAWFRLTGMGPLPSQALLALSERTAQWYLKSFNMEFRIQRWCAFPSEHPWAGMTEMGALFESAWEAAGAEPGRVWLNFHSPTTFELSENRWGNWMHLPVPRLVFRNLRTRTRECTPIAELPIAEEEDIIDNHIALGQFRQISSHMLPFQKHGFRRAGFTGECEFLFDRDLSEPARVWLHLLANLAFYSGVGRETTRGMGQVRREPAAKFSYRGHSKG